MSNKVAEPELPPLPAFSFNDYLDELIEIEKDVAECRLVLGSKKKRRRDLLTRLILTLDKGRKKLAPIMREVSQKLDR